MKRRDWVKNSLMAIAVSLLPKVLRPMDGEVEDDLINPDEVVSISIMDYAKGNVIVYEPNKYHKLFWD